MYLQKLKQIVIWNEGSIKLIRLYTEYIGILLLAI
jgi:hypothetical protein